jgi:hypothetical protein
MARRSKQTRRVKKNKRKTMKRQKGGRFNLNSLVLPIPFWYSFSDTYEIFESNDAIVEKIKNLEQKNDYFLLKKSDYEETHHTSSNSIFNSKRAVGRKFTFKNSLNKQQTNYIKPLLFLFVVEPGNEQNLFADFVVVKSEYTEPGTNNTGEMGSLYSNNTEIFEGTNPSKNKINTFEKDFEEDFEQDLINLKNYLNPQKSKNVISLANKDEHPFTNNTL